MTLDAVVVGSGPNGLAAAITLARHGCSVLVIEAADTIGGGTRSASLTLPGFLHDFCSAVHPLGVASDFFRSVPLHEFGLEWIHPEVVVAHPMADGDAAALYRDLSETCRGFGRDGPEYQRLLQPFMGRLDQLLSHVLGPLRLPRHFLLLTRFGLHAIRSASRFASSWFQEERVRGMFAGMAAHSVMPLDQRFTAAVGLMFCVMAHGGGWPIARGGSQQIASAMGSYLKSLGGEIVTGQQISDFSELPAAKTVLFDVGPRSLSSILGTRLPNNYRKQLARFRYGPAAFKVDWALSGPIPWTANACRKAGTVHVGNTLEEIAHSEAAAWGNQPAERPFTLVSQQSLFDPSRAPVGKQTGWAYCHVPHGSTFDMTDRIEAQIERFAPGFRQLILARHVTTPHDFELYNPNYVGGDITGGAMSGWQMFARPVARFDPYSTPLKNVFLCSASTPPGAGVHGMCGFFAARSALHRLGRR